MSKVSDERKSMKMESFELKEHPYMDEAVVIAPFKGFVGYFHGKFLEALRDQGKIMGVRCPQCDKVYMPPRTTCGECFSEISDWVELSHTGVLESYTMVGYGLPVQPVEPPFVFGLIKLDGADTSFVHLINEVDLADLRIGMRVKAVLKDTREGSILDIKYFKPI